MRFDVQIKTLTWWWRSMKSQWPAWKYVSLKTTIFHPHQGHLSLKMTYILIIIGWETQQYFFCIWNYTISIYPCRQEGLFLMLTLQGLFPHGSWRSINKWAGFIVMKQTGKFCREWRASLSLCGRVAEGRTVHRPRVPQVRSHRFLMTWPSVIELHHWSLGLELL